MQLNISLREGLISSPHKLFVFSVFRNESELEIIWLVAALLCVFEMEFNLDFICEWVCVCACVRVCVSVCKFEL